jgi:hypothetical protein
MEKQTLSPEKLAEITLQAVGVVELCDEMLQLVSGGGGDESPDRSTSWTDSCYQKGRWVCP